MAPTPDGLGALLREEGYGSDLFNPRQHECSELVEQYALQSAIHVAVTLGVTDALSRPQSLSELMTIAALAPSFQAPITWILRLLAYWDVISCDGRIETGRMSIHDDVPDDARAGLRARCLELDANCLPNLNLFDAAAAIYPRVARGEVRAEHALLSRVDLWSDYFSNRNPIYALCNRVMARCAAARVPRSGARLLEVGAGLGSGTEALLEALCDRGAKTSIDRYEVTEPIAFFRDRAKRALTASYPGLPLTFSPLDMNADWRTQRSGPPAQVVVGCNVFHLARDLTATLRQAAETLDIGGWLVVGECVRPFPGQPIGAEFPLELLSNYRDVRLDPHLRPCHGFLAPEHWLRAFEEAGFVDVTITPDVRRARALHPRFNCAAIAGRRMA